MVFATRLTFSDLIYCLLGSDHSKPGEYILHTIYRGGGFAFLRIILKYILFIHYNKGGGWG